MLVMYQTLIGKTLRLYVNKCEKNALFPSLEHLPAGWMAVRIKRKSAGNWLFLLFFEPISGDPKLRQRIVFDTASAIVSSLF
jgi:hypothetical protein